MSRAILGHIKSIILLSLATFCSNVFSFELLSEGAMGSVSALSANSAEEIVSIAGSSAAGLRIDDDYESLPFQVDVVVEEYDLDEVSSELNFSLTKEVESWAQNLDSQSIAADANSEVGYIDVLPASVDADLSFIIPEFTGPATFDPDSSGNERESDAVAVNLDQTLELLGNNLETIETRIIRRIDFVATIDSTPDDVPSVGSGYISNLSSYSNVKIAAFRD